MTFEDEVEQMKGWSVAHCFGTARGGAGRWGGAAEGKDPGKIPWLSPARTPSVPGLPAVPATVTAPDPAGLTCPRASPCWGTRPPGWEGGAVGL